jgi:hypothetical protein
MIVKIARQKPRMKALYFVGLHGDKIARVVTDATETLVQVFGYRRCSYRMYLNVRRSLRKSERKELRPCKTQ